MIEELKTDYKNDVLATSQQGKRTFNIVGKNGEILFEDVHIEDTSKYLQVGDEYGSDVINEINEYVNQMDNKLDELIEFMDNGVNAEDVTYNDSNVKLTLDTLETRIDGKQDKLTNPLTQSDVKNNLTSTDTNKPLSASQGKVLNDKIANKKLTIGTPTVVYNGDSTYITNTTTLYTATSDGFITLCPVIMSGYGSIYIGSTNNFYFNALPNEMRANISGFIKKGETVKLVNVVGSGVRKDMLLTFIPISV